MEFKLNMAISAVLSADTIKDLIKEAVEAETSRYVTNISFNMKKVSRGYGPMEYDEWVFDSATVELGNELDG